MSDRAEERAREWLENAWGFNVSDPKNVKSLAAEFRSVREEAFQEAHEGGVLYRTIRAERDAEVARVVREMSADWIQQDDPSADWVKGHQVALRLRLAALFACDEIRRLLLRCEP
jgi:hypothetical protein